MKRFFCILLFILLIPGVVSGITISGIGAAGSGVYEPADANILKTTELNSEALLESVSQTQVATESEAQGYVNKEQLDTNGDVVDVAATLASNDSDDMLVTAGAIIDYITANGGGNTDKWVAVLDENTALATGDGFSGYNWTAPPLYGAGVDYQFGTVGVIASVGTASTSGIPSFQIYNVTDSTDVFTTNITIDATEKNSLTATTAYAYGTLITISPGDEFRFDCDVAGTGTEDWQLAFPVEAIE